MRLKYFVREVTQYPGTYIGAYQEAEKADWEDEFWRSQQ